MWCTLHIVKNILIYVLYQSVAWFKQVFLSHVSSKLLKLKNESSSFVIQSSPDHCSILLTIEETSIHKVSKLAY